MSSWNICAYLWKSKSFLLNVFCIFHYNYLGLTCLCEICQATETQKHEYRRQQQTSKKTKALLLSETRKSRSWLRGTVAFSPLFTFQLEAKTGRTAASNILVKNPMSRLGNTPWQQRDVV